MTASPVTASPDPARQLLRHTLATVAYRGGKALRRAPDRFGTFHIGDKTRTPSQILAHMGDLFDWALSIAQGKPAWRDSAPLSWDAEMERFFAAIQKFDDYLASSEPLHGSAEGLFSQAYGRFEARIKIPAGQGMWPAFWMLGNDISTVGWPKCGEIDIMENIGKEPGTVHGSLHGPSTTGPTSDTSDPFSLPAGQKFADDVHLYAVEWEPGVVRFYVDANLYATVTQSQWPAGGAWVFDHPFFIILNVAVGGDWPGSPDNTTVFPQQMLVDYVRVYAKQ